jgi:hypothetical protein
LAIKRDEEVFCFVLGVNLEEGLVISLYDISQENSARFSSGNQFRWAESGLLSTLLREE